jgi:hypothetical protein
MAFPSKDKTTFSRQFLTILEWGEAAHFIVNPCCLRPGVQRLFLAAIHPHQQLFGLGVLDLVDQLA